MSHIDIFFVLDNSYKVTVLLKSAHKKKKTTDNPLPYFHFFQVLLTSDKAAANFSDRSLLKNLGHWLGMITLAKNKPILYTVSL